MGIVIVLNRKSMGQLRDFLLTEFRKRREDDDFFSVREWAREIKISNSTLSRYMNKGGDNIEITPKNLAVLVDYFGQPFLDVLEVRVPVKPRNPKYKSD